MATKNILVRAGADFSKMNKSFQSTQKTLSNFQKNVSSSMDRVNQTMKNSQTRLSGTMSKIKLALAAIGIGTIVKDSVQAAMSVEASIQQINRIMGVNANGFMDWANKQATAFNMSKQEALKYGSVYGNLISGFTKSTKETTTYTENLLKSSAIVASGTGRSMEDVMERIRSSLLGNTESIEDLGINVNIAMIESTNAFKRFAGNKSWQKLDYQTQQQIRLFAILEQASKKYGDSININTASSQQKFVAQLNNIKLALGQAFLPIYNSVLPALTNLAQKIAEVMNKFAGLMQTIFGKPIEQQQAQVDTTNNQTNAVSDLGDAYQTAGKKAKGALASFDQINTLGNGSVDSGTSKTAGNNTTSSSPVKSPQIDKANKSLDNMKAKLQEIYDKFGGKELIVKTSIGLDYLKTSILSALTSLKNAFTPIFVQVKATLSNNIESLQKIGQNIGNTVGESIRIALSNFGDITDVIAKGFEGFVSKNKISIQGFIDTTLTNLITTVSNITGAISSLTDKFGKLRDEFWATSKTDIIQTLQAIYDTGYKLVSPFLSELSTAWKNATDKMNQFAQSTGVQLYLNGLKDVLCNFIVPALKTFAERCSTIANIVNPVLTPALNKLGAAFNYCFGEWLNRVSKVLGFFGTLASKLSSIANFFVTVPAKFDSFKSTISSFATSVSKSFNRLSENMFSGFKTPLESIRKLANKFITMWNGIKFELPSIQLPSIMGGGKIGGGKFTVPQINSIPALANGGLAYSETFAMIGDNINASTDPEVVSPLSKLQELMGGSNKDVINMLSQILRVIQTKDTTIKIGETELARVVIGAINNYQRQTGKSLLMV